MRRAYAALLLPLLLLAATVVAQQPVAPAPNLGPLDAEEMANAALAPLPAPASPPDNAEALLGLLMKGGWLMAPIAVMSIVVIAIMFERLLGLRRSRIRPRGLVLSLRELADSDELDPQHVYNLCRKSRSVLSRVVISTLSKGGRPHAEVEAAANDSLQNEADRMYGNVRTLNLAAAVTPLMGLLGTVWGMIQSFFVTANAAEGVDKAAALAEGIYVALMTTFAGLAVAIPAAVLAHYFEGRILHSLRKVESLMTILLPRIESLEGRGRVDVRRLEQAYQGSRRRRGVDRHSPAASPPPPHLTSATDLTSKV